MKREIVSDYKKSLEKLNHEASIDNFINDVYHAHNKRELILFLGAGVSMSQGFPTWDNYIKYKFEYWKFHLKNEEETGFSIKDINEINSIFDDIHLDKKRKLDILDFKLEKVMGEDFQEYKNEFENEFFLKTIPINSENEILKELVKLGTFFITTNYDQQIEKYLKNINNREPIVFHDLKSFNYKDVDVSKNSVLHFHGTPYKNATLVNSTSSYNEVYLDKNTYKESFEKFILNFDNPVLIFIGSNLQEEEIINFFNFKNKSLKKYALMPFQFKNNNEGNLIKEYYSIKKLINIIWYGTEYHHLPKFLTDINQEIINKRDEEYRQIIEEDLKNNLVKNDISTFNENLRALVNRKNSYIIDSYFEKYGLENIEDFLNNKDFLNSISSEEDYFHLFKEINSRYNNLSIKIINKIINIIKSTKFILGFNSLSIISKYLMKVNENERLTFYMDNIYSRLSYIDGYPCGLADNTQWCLWLSSKIEDQSFSQSYLPPIDTLKIPIKFSNKTLHFLLKSLKKIPLYTLSYEFEKFITMKPSIKFLYNGIRLSKIKNSRKIWPKYFLENPVVQKIFIQLDLEDKLDKDQLQLLIDCIKENKNNEYLGEDLNKFIKKNNLDISYSKLISGELKIENGENKEYNYLVNKLANENNISISSITKIIEKTYTNNYGFIPRETGKKLITSLVQKMPVHTNYKFYENLIINLLKVKRKKLREYNFLIQDIILLLSKESDFSINILQEYFTVFEDTKNYEIIFSNESYNNLIKFSENSTIKKYLMNYLAIVKQEELNWNTSLDFKFNSFKFINSPAKNFYFLIDKIFKKEQYLSQNFLKEIDLLSPKKKEFLYGMLNNLFKDKINFNSKYCFLGISQVLILEKDYASKFEKAVASILNEDMEFTDKIFLINITRTMIWKLRPKDIDISERVRYSKNKETIFLSLSSYFLNKEIDSLDDNTYMWIEWFSQIEEYTPLLINILKSNIDKKNATGIIKLIKKYSNLLSKKSWKIDQLVIISKNKLTSNSANLLNELISVLYNNHNLTVTRHSINFISFYLENLSDLKLHNEINKFLHLSKLILNSQDQKYLEDNFKYK